MRGVMLSPMTGDSGWNWASRCLTRCCWPASDWTIWRSLATLACAACWASCAASVSWCRRCSLASLLPGEVFNGRGPAEHLLRVAAGEEREGLVRRAAHIARRGEPGELVVRGGELPVHPLRPVGGRLGVGFRPAEHLQLAAVLLGQLGRLVLQLRHGRRGGSEQPASHAISGERGRGHGPGRRGEQRAWDKQRQQPHPSCAVRGRASVRKQPTAFGGVPAAHQLTSPLPAQR